MHSYTLLWHILLLISTSLTDFPKRISQKERVVTNPSRADGFGAQFQTIIAAALYAELTHQKFVYTPFKTMEHNYTHDPDFITKKETLINFIDHFERYNNTKHICNVNHITPKSLIDFFESNIVACAQSTTLRTIKQLFRVNKNVNDYFDTSCFNIAIHIRRHNQHDSRIQGTNTPNAVFLNVMHALRHTYASHNPVFHIYSQGDPEQFSTLCAPDVLLHLNDSVEETFSALVFADVLVTSQSSFSYTAGLLSDGLVYYIPFWHAPLPHWISIKNLI